MIGGQADSANLAKNRACKNRMRQPCRRAPRTIYAQQLASGAKRNPGIWRTYLPLFFGYLRIAGTPAADAPDSAFATPDKA
jgi:hypothetical protein